MNLTLTWDLFIIVFFAIVIAYTFIIGKKESVKIIISTYIAIVTVQALGNVLERGLAYSGSLLGNYGLGTLDASALSWIKLAVFVAVIIFLAVRAGFDIVYANNMNPIVDVAITAVLGCATAGLLLSTLFVYVSGVPLLDNTLATTAPLVPAVQQSQMMRLLILQQDLWFAFPALALIATGFLHKE